MKKETEPINESSIEVEEAPLSEIREIFSLFREQLNDWEYGEAVEVFGGAFQARDGRVFTIKQEGKIDGLSSVSFDGDRAVFDGFYVRREKRGQGTGTILAEKALEYLISRGFTKISVNIASGGSRKIFSRIKDKYKDVLDIVDHGDHFA